MSNLCQPRRPARTSPEPSQPRTKRIGASQPDVFGWVYEFSILPAAEGKSRGLAIYKKHVDGRKTFLILRSEHMDLLKESIAAFRDAASEEKSPAAKPHMQRNTK
jgi:hypothetical protein